MTDEHAAGQPQGTPGQRALGAMESAVRRARATAGAPPLPPTPAPSRLPPPAPPPPPQPPPPLPTSPSPSAGAPAGPVDAAPPPQAVRPPVRTDRWLVGSVAVVAVLVVVAAIALAVSLSGGPATPPSTVAGPTHAGSTHPGSPRSNPGAGGATPTSTNTSTTVVAAPGGPPVISSLSPSSGSAGQGIQVAGANFLSTSGQIVATFNGQVAPTSCPAQNSCTITVPASTSPSAQVVITTASGTSNAVTFTYS
jgi:hypothetical protein